MPSRLRAKARRRGGGRAGDGCRGGPPGRARTRADVVVISRKTGQALCPAKKHLRPSLKVRSRSRVPIYRLAPMVFTAVEAHSPLMPRCHGVSSHCAAEALPGGVAERLGPVCAGRAAAEPVPTNPDGAKAALDRILIGATRWIGSSALRRDPRGPPYGRGVEPGEPQWY